MKKTTDKQRKLEYERIVKLVKEARIEAEEFIQKNKQIESKLQINFSS